jgi:multidrug efflux pump subunit AcrA (membrane-fusion protein)
MKHGLILSALAALLAASCGKSVKAQYAVVAKRTALETILASGRVGGSRIVPLSFQRGGQVARVAVKAGQSVRAGDTLISLWSEAEKNRFNQAAGAVNIARIGLEKSLGPEQAAAFEALNQAAVHEEAALNQLVRYEALLRDNAVAGVEAEKARQEHVVALSRKRAAEARLNDLKGPEQRLLEARISQAVNSLEAARIELSHSFLRAPEDGLVAKVSAEPGQTVSPGLAVCRFLPLDTTTHVELQVDESEIGKIRTGQAARVGLASARERVFEASVRDIVPLIDPSRGTVTVQLALKGRPEGLLPDQGVSAQIVLDTFPDALIAEQRFLRFSPAGDSAFVLKGGRASRVRLSARDLGDGRFRILEGLSEGDTLLSGPGLTDNGRVTLLP